MPLAFRAPSYVSLAAGALALLCLCGCPPQSNTNGNSDDNANGNTSPVSDGDRLTALDEVKTAVDTIVLDGDPAKTTQIAQLLQSMSAFERVEEGDGVVFAKFTGGEFLVIMNNRPNIDPTDVPPTSKRINRDARGAAVAKEPAPVGTAAKPNIGRTQPADAQPKSRVPESTKAVLVNTMGTDYCDITPQISPWLSRAGYSVTTLDGGVESLRTGVTDVGVLYYNGHGSVVPSWAVPLGLPSLVEGFPHFGLWTRTKVTADNLPTYRKELEDGFLIYALCPTDRIAGNLNDCLDRKGSDQSSEYHYCLTDYFIDKYWRCKPGALLYMDCCHGAQSDSLLPELCTNSNVGAAAVVGWTRATLDQWATPTALYFFDRLTGANEYPPLVAPPRRPYSVNGVMDAMKAVVRSELPMDESPSFKGLFLRQVKEPAYVARLIALYADGTSDIVLRPGVKQLSVNEGQNRLILEGDFGDAPGTVTLDGSALALSGAGWTTSRIECDIAKNAAGSAVVFAGGRASPGRRLTQWNVTLHQFFMDYPTQQSTNCPSCFYEATIHYTLRADVSGTRAAPEDGVAPPGFIGPASDGDIEVTNAGGTFSIGQGSSITLAPNANDGAALIGTCIGFLPTADNNYFGACFHLDGASRTIALSPTLSAEGLFRNYHGGVYDGIVDPHQIIYYGNLIGNELVLALSPNFNIEPGQKATGANSYFQWERAPAINPAQADDPR